MKHRILTITLLALIAAPAMGLSALEGDEPALEAEVKQDTHGHGDEHAEYEPFFERYLQTQGFDISDENLVKLLEHETLTVREYAATILGQRKVLAAISALQQRAKEDPAPSVRVEAAIALGKMGDRSGMDTLRNALTLKEWFELPMIAAGALAVLGEPTGYPVVKEGLKDERKHFRFRALTELPNFFAFSGKTEQGVEIQPEKEIFALLTSDPDPFIRENAAYLLGNVLTAEKAPKLAEVKADSPESVRNAIDVALEMIKARDAGAAPAPGANTGDE